ncbi:restriction endonuclease subunit S [Polaromonas sp. A23]|uniref:restriction endonuclease subunit S n=1 Tax=Polaromonas sp. A23 TaxID=1944133 RepID=UPI001C2B7FD2|nr:restriction endonuclease subunit S [Polaromonas sp. A23]
MNEPLGSLLGERGYIRGPFGSALVRKELQSFGIPVYEQQHAISGTREFRFYVGQEKFDELKRFAVKANDLIISCSGTVGRISTIREGDPLGIISQALLILRPDVSKVLPKFLGYFLGGDTGQRALIQASHGTVQVNIAPRSVVETIPIPVPSLEEQQAIVQVLGSIDDKIELNGRLNETLEAMACTLFQSWFVDFDPVRAKANGDSAKSICQRWGLTPELLALFPDSFGNSELGEIPNGWTVRGLDDVANYLNGLALQKYPALEGKDWLPVIKIAQLRAGHTLSADKASTQVPAPYVIENGDVLFSWSGSLEVEIWCGGRGALNQHLFKVTSGEYPKWFYFLWTRFHLSFFRDIAANKATTMGHIQRKHLSEAKVLCPPMELLDEMTKVLMPLIEMTISNRLEAGGLSNVRTALLPELLSGNVAVVVEAELS